MQEIIQQIRTELHGMWRYRWPAMIAAWIVCLVGWTTVFSMPDIYQASAKVYVDADSRLADVMGQVGVAPGVGSRVFVVRQAMLGRPQLERVARETDLDLRARTEEEKESLLFSLSEKVSVESGRSSQARNLYTITFEDRDREMAIAVVQTLLDTFVEDVLELKEQGTEDVTDYLEDQLAHYSGLLSDSEAKVADFNKQYVGLLPGESGGIFERLSVEMELLKQLRLDLRIETDERNELRRQLETEEPMLPEGAEGLAGLTVTGSPTEIAIADLETRKSGLLLTFTERHPDVVAIDEQLAQLFEKRRVEVSAMQSSGLGMEGIANATNPVYQSVQIALNESNVSIAGIRSQIAQRDALVKSLNNQVGTIPEIEAQYAELTRNYTQYQSLYNELLMQKERERMGTVGDERDIVSFNIVEPPSATYDPVAPQRGLLILGALIAGLAIGGGIAFLLHQLNPVFHDVSTLRKVSGRPILGVVSMTWLERGRAKRRFDFMCFAGVSMGLIFVFLCTVLFQDMGVVIMHGLLRQIPS
jgi:polysaccharide chain length determinant protein (PEP-CTERM system associated)